MIDTVHNLAQIFAYEHRCGMGAGPCAWCRSLAERTINHVRNQRGATPVQPRPTPTA